MNHRELRASGPARVLCSRSHQLIAVALLFFGANLFAQIPSGYYDTTAGQTGQQLADALHEIIDDHVRYPYTSSSTDVWDVVSIADEDPANAANIITIYENDSKPKSDHSTTGWNREHSWPKSYGFGDDNDCNYPYTDVHHLFAADWNYNSARSNKPFDNCVSGCSEWPTVNATSSNWTEGSFNLGTWEPWDDVKGDLARAMFYMAVRYNGGSHGITGCGEPDLILTNDRSLIQTTGGNASVAYMGILDTLLAWHAADPVDGFEQARNEVVFGFQGNRNPFVDHPEWVSEVFGSGNGGGGTGGGTGGGGGGGGGTGGGGGNTGDGALWINEIHYDNASTDADEGVEIAGPAGTTLDGWQLVAYNGNGGTAYNTVTLSGTLADQQNGYGTQWVGITGLQNGSPDGIALVDPTGTVVQFLSYEGSFDATDGPAVGVTSTDLGVGESSSTPLGFSLQLTGEGTSYADFTWATEAAHTNGLVNNNQVFPTTTTADGDLWINEIHYDNSSTDTGEGIEIAGPAGTVMDGWQLVGYNGNGGVTYNTVDLSGSLADQADGFGFAWYAISGLQNGSPDGVALVDPSGAVVQFLSYEGGFTATNGPANGLASEDIGVSESSSTPVGFSLQLGGQGSQYSDFTWQTQMAATNDALNTNQDFGSGGGGGNGGGNGGETLVWINEIHYDNSSTDSGEGIEIAGPAGTSTDGWQLVAYNGNGGAQYNSVDLSGTLGDDSNGFGFTWYAISGLQNGSPDGIALVDPSGAVVQFLSYEGGFTAVDGPAAGLSSVDIGVGESSSTPVGFSLQLGGTGTTYADFSWEAAAAHTNGALNNNQTFPIVVVLPDPWINEVHYDNSSTDTDEGIEVAGPAGLDLSGWQLVGYNGNGGSAYRTVDLGGAIDDEQNGYGALWFAFSGLQNGSPDGIALVNPSGVVVQFLSYEGTLVAGDGPAAGMTSVDLGVSEASQTPVGESLQLTGRALVYADFQWQQPAAHSRGDLNVGQILAEPLPDADGDGVEDGLDACAASILGPTVVINGCDTGVANWVSVEGCTLADMIAALEEGNPPAWRYRNSLNALLGDLVAGGDLTAVEQSAVMSCASAYGLPTARDDSYTTTWDTPLIVDAPGVLANDTDPTGDSLEAHLLTPPVSGSLTLNRDGSFTYVPQIGLAGPVSFVYKAWDGSGYRTATVTIEVTSGNQAPVTADDFYTTSVNGRLVVDAPGVLANDADPEGDALTAYLFSEPAQGHLGFHGDGGFWYEPPLNFTGTVTFVYRAGDGVQKSAATVTILVQ